MITHSYYFPESEEELLEAAVSQSCLDLVIRKTWPLLKSLRKDRSQLSPALALKSCEVYNLKLGDNRRTV